MDINEIEIVRSNRKTVSVEIKNDMRVIVRAPMRMKSSDIIKFLKLKEEWIQTHLEKMKEKRACLQESFTDEQLKSFAWQAKRDIPLKVEKYANQLGVTANRVTIRCQKTRWGSCSSKGNLNFNCLLVLCPEVIIDYVVVHELCHIKYLNHSKKFWALVESILPDYESNKKWLIHNGLSIIGRLS